MSSNKKLLFKMGCCQGCARWLIGTVSICVIICAVICGVVIYKKEKDKNWSKLIKNNIPFIFILVTMCFAVVSALIGFLLCCCHARCLYITYLIIIIIVILIEVAAIVLAFCFKDKIIDGIRENWSKEKFEKSRRQVESDLKCCGFDNTTEESESDCGYPYDSSKDPPLEACYPKIKREIDSHMKGLRIAVIVMGVVELVLFICACYLVCSSGGDGEGISKF